MLTTCWLVAQDASAAGVPLENIHIRDPFILPAQQERSYYLVASSGRSVSVRQSEDLKTWGEPKTVFAIPENFRGGDSIWAPEIHQYRGPVEDTGGTLRCWASAQANAATPEPSGEKDSWVFAYFRQRYEGRVEIDAQGRTRTAPLPNPMKEEQLHLALSTDGRHWEPLNGNRPVWNQWLRDPFVGRGPDGLWHLVATGGRPASRSGQTNLGPACLYASSRDLLKWENVGSLHLMQGVHDEAGRLARNIWAPEWCLDHSTGEIVLLWSSSFENAGWKRSRLWFCRTRDWQTFTPAKILFAPPYSVIDGTLLERGGIYYLFHKEEEFGAKTGERRAIRLATSDRLEGSYQIHQGPLNQGQIAPVITEGPSVMPDPTKPGWLLLYDYCMSDGYGISSSPDLIRWSIEESVSMPPDARHGSVARLTAAEAAALRASLPNKND